VIKIFYKFKVQIANNKVNEVFNEESKKGFRYEIDMKAIFATEKRKSTHLRKDEIQLNALIVGKL
jgi:hypothetical protein